MTNTNETTASNAARMREALTTIREKCVIYNNALAEEIDAICGNALAAPPRNCDRHDGDAKKLHDEWWEWSGDRKNCNEDGTVKLTFGEWLLAKAEGDAK